MATSKASRVKIKAPRSKIQLALQGGGAKLSALLAVAEAVQELNDKKIIQLERVAGTSAGAIVGALLAANVPIAEVRHSLRTGKGAELVAAFPTLSKAEMGVKFLAGEPFWSTAPLEAWLTELFESVDVKKISDCKHVRQLLIMAANVSTGEMKPFTGDDDLVPALLCSAGLPICFRTWKSTNGDGELVIDGGIGENLPIERLSKETNRFGEMVAVTFKTTPSKLPTNGIAYTLSVLSTAIDVSVRQACAKVPKNRLFIAETKVNTFDFEKAVSVGLEDPEYKGIRGKARRFFSAIPHQPADVDPWEIRDPSMEAMMSDLSAVYEKNLSTVKFEYEEVVTIGTARCLLPLDVEAGPEPDELYFTQVFRPIEHSTSCFAVSLAGFAGRQYLGRINPELRDPKGRLIGCTPLPCLPTHRPIGPDERQLIVFFDEPLLPGGGYYTSAMRDVGPNIMWPLQQTGSDELGLFLPRAEGVIRKAIFVLYVPETYPWLEIKTIPENAGKELDDSEYLRLRLYPPNGFRPIGWMFENVKADGIFGVTYHDSSKETACETGSDN